MIPRRIVGGEVCGRRAGPAARRYRRRVRAGGTPDAPRAEPEYLPLLVEETEARICGGEIDLIADRSRRRAGARLRRRDSCFAGVLDVDRGDVDRDRENDVDRDREERGGLRLRGCPDLDESQRRLTCDAELLSPTSRLDHAAREAARTATSPIRRRVGAGQHADLGAAYAAAAAP